MFVLVPGSLVLGIICSGILIQYVPFIPWLFGFVTFVMGLGCKFRDVTAAFGRPLLFLNVFVIAHVLSPLMAFGIGNALFGENADYTAGLVLFTVIPLGVSSVLWVSMARGPVPLILALVVADSLLSPLIVPFSISLLFGEMVHFDTWDMLVDLLLIVVLPMIGGIVVNELSKGQAKPKTAPVTLPLSKLAFMAVVMFNAAAIGPFVHSWGWDAFYLFMVVILVVAACYAVGAWSSSLFRTPQSTVEERAALRGTLGFACGMRNNSLGIVLAMQYFGPEAAVAVVLSILIQQPGATLFYALLQKFNTKAPSQKEVI
ncbi:bile acid:sodium symporter family protein [Paenibacillus sp. 481]|nr:bile acid:sodium symporter family protein [Paenibacillus sp. 481]